MSKQLDHSTHSVLKEKFPIVIVADNITGEANIGSIFRLADAFHIEEIIFTGTPINIKSNRLKRTARNTFETVSYRFEEEILPVIQQYTENEYSSLALEITSDSIALEEYKFVENSKILLVIGNERHGISTSVLQAIPTKLHITMYGTNSSMNVSQATGIALYEFSKIFNTFHQK